MRGGFLKGIVSYELYDKFGNLKSSGQNKNTVVNTGRAWTANRLQAGTGAAEARSAQMRWMDLGRSAATVVGTDTGLKQAITGAIATVDTAQRSGVTAIWIHTWTLSELSAPIQEAGIFNSHNQTVTSIILARTVFSPVINKTLSDTLKITWKIRVDAV